MCLSFQQNKKTGTRTVVEKPKIKQIQYPKNIAKILTDPKSGSQRNNRKTFMIKKNQFLDFGVLRSFSKTDNENQGSLDII